MSWIRRRPLLSLALLAFVLRAGLAVVTEYKPLFPSYYYTDAEVIDEAAWQAAEAWRSGADPGLPGSPSQRIHAFLLGKLYSAVGRRPLAAKIAMAAAGAAAIAIYYSLCAAAFSPAVAGGSALLLALWPSHVFFTSQNFKEAPTFALCYLAFCGGLAAMSRPSPGLGLAHALAAGLGVFLVGFLRGYVMAVCVATLAAGLLMALVARWRRGLPKAPLLLCLAAITLAPRLYLATARSVLSGPFKSNVANKSDPVHRVDILPSTYIGERGTFVHPYSPRGISEMRLIRQEADRQWARVQRGREIGTQLFPGLQLDSWLDLLLFLPKGMFYVLFMPLPGLYPLGHNLGRILASLENLGLLALALAAIAGVLRGPKTPARATMLLFFFVMACGSALLEFDLGSSARHRLLYMPMLFPFALSLVARRPAPGGGARLKVFQVLECGGPGGTGRQVAALCNGLDPARFECALVYAVRDGEPEKYRRGASGAAKAFYVPEMVREISPAQDIRALVRLFRIFRAEAPDAVHCHSSKAGVLARLAAWAAGVPKIYYSPRGYGFLQTDRSWGRRALYRALEWSVSWIGEIVAVSPSEAALAQPLAWGKTVHIVCDPLLGDIPEADWRDGSLPAVVGSCARLTAARNPAAFVDLCQHLNKARPGLRFIWIGGGEEEDSVRGRIASLELSAQVEVTGWLEPEPARRRMRELDLFVHYSRWDALPNAVMEAMALGLPVVASDIPGNRDLVSHGETGYLAKSESELLEFCLKLVDDPALRRRLGQAGRERALRDFGLKAALSRLEGLYGETTER